MESSASLESCNGQSSLNYSASLGWAEPKHMGCAIGWQDWAEMPRMGDAHAVTGVGSQLPDKSVMFQHSEFLNAGKNH